MSMAIHMMLGIPLSIAYVISAVVIIPLSTHGISRISRLQAWTQPVWLILQILPLVYIGLNESTAFANWLAFRGVDDGLIAGEKQTFNLLLFGAAAAVIFPLIAQNGEQADFLRFLPDKKQCQKRHWWMAVIGAGPGWVVFGIVKLFIGSFLAVLALQHGLPVDLASDPAHMYTVAFNYITANPDMALWLAGIFVIISQLKINVTNAYAGSIAWGNFFSRLTHSHPGRVVWLVFNVAIALMLMELGLYQAFETILITYASLVVAWIGCVVADLIINKPLGISPKHIEFRRGHLYDINPVGVVSMIIASCTGIAANLGVFGETAEALAAFLSLSIPFVTVPLIGWLTGGRFYLARPQNEVPDDELRQQCHVCENSFDQEDMSHCPSYEGAICSLCCALDARCGDQCRPDAHLAAQTSRLFSRILPEKINQQLHSVTGHFLAIFVITAGIIAGLLSIVFYAQKDKSVVDLALISGTLWQVFFLFLILTGVLIWLYVLAQKSARFALKETQLQAELLTQEVNAHEITAVELAHARDAANSANLAKSRYLSGVSHELRTPLNTIFGYAQLMESDALLEQKNQKIATVIRRSSEHLSDVIEGLLEISKIEARKLDLHRDTIDLRALVQQLDDMFRPQAENKNLEFIMHCEAQVPEFVSTDEKRLRQILLNLISNAIKFTSHGKVELNISYRNQVALINIKDTGQGIAKADQQRIFEPFVRVQNAHSPQVSGTGLGLSISRLLVEMMGGSLKLNSEPQQGSEFCLKLFLPSVNEVLEKSQKQADIEGYLERPQHIMVVDDESSHRNLIYDLLHPLGFIIHQAASAELALDLIDQQFIDCFLLDISMPGMDGWQLLAELRKRGVNVPVIILSADSYIAAQQTQKNADYQAYVSKPVRLDKLLEQLQRCLGLHWRSASSVDAPENKHTQVGGVEDNRPDANLITSLREFAKIGYLKGVLECTQKLEQKTPDAEWIRQFRALADKCDLDGIVIAIDKLLMQEGDTN